VDSGSGTGHDSALTMLDTLMRRMSEQHLAEAHRLVGEPQPKPAANGSVVASPSDGGRQEPASGHREAKAHRAGLSNRSMHHGRIFRVHVPLRRFARPWEF